MMIIIVPIVIIIIWKVISMAANAPSNHNDSNDKRNNKSEFNVLYHDIKDQYGNSKGTATTYTYKDKYIETSNTEIKYKEDTRVKLLYLLFFETKEEQNYAKRNFNRIGRFTR